MNKKKKQKVESASQAKIRIVNELYRPARKNFKRRRTIIRGLDDLWQIDLAEYQQYARINSGYRFILVVIDCFSKYVWTRPLKNKTADAVTDAVGDILNEGRTPENIQSDDGREFFNRKFKDLMQKHNINHYSTFSVKKAAIVERVIRTLKEKIHKQFNLRGTYRWLDIIPVITAAYNDTRHRTIKMKPKNVNGQNEEAVRKSVYSHIKVIPKRRYHVGDVVRLSKYKELFEKGYTPRWSTELFKVTKAQLTNPVTYLLTDMSGKPISGGFYEEELQKTSQPDIYLVEKILRKKGRKMYVKWLGLDKSHNSWISSTDIK